MNPSPLERLTLPFALLALLTALSTIAWPGAARADESEPRPSSAWKGQASASLSLTAGNSNSAATLLNVDLARKLRHSKTSLLARLNHATSEVNGVRQTASQNWGVSVQHDRDLGDTWFAFSKLGFDGDRALYLDLRTTVSSGLGYHFLPDVDDSFDVFAGLSVNDRRYRVDQTVHGRQGRNFTQPGALLGEETSHQLSDTVSLKQRLEAYPDLSSSRAHTVRFNGNLQVMVTRTLSLSLGLVSNYNHRVSVGARRSDTTLFTGLSVRLGN